MAHPMKRNQAQKLKQLQLFQLVSPLTKVTHLCSNFSLIYVSDFFDSDLKKSKSAENPPESGPNRPSGSNSNENENEAETEAEQTMDEEELKSMADKLPEGFFDDPKKDAKVRRKNVQPTTWFGNQALLILILCCRLNVLGARSEVHRQGRRGVATLSESDQRREPSKSLH